MKQTDFTNNWSATERSDSRKQALKNKNKAEQFRKGKKYMPIRVDAKTIIYKEVKS